MAGIDKINRIKTKTIPTIVRSLKKVFSVHVDIYFPATNKSIYGNYDQTIEYNDTPDISDEFLVSGIFKKNYTSDGDIIDPFLEEEMNKKLYDEVDRELPIGSLAVVTMGEIKMRYKIDTLLQSMSDKKQALLRIYKLVPVG